MSESETTSDWNWEMISAVTFTLDFLALKELNYWKIIAMINIILQAKWAKPKKTVWRRAFFVNSAFGTQCHIIKNTLQQTAFSAVFSDFAHWETFESSIKYRF